MSKLGTKFILGRTSSALILLQMLLLSVSKIPLLTLTTWRLSLTPLSETRAPLVVLSATLVVFSLKDPTCFPNHRQYSLKPEAKLGLQPVISKFLQHGLFVPTNAPCNTPNLPVQRKKKKNEAVVVPNPYILPGTILPETQWFTTLDLTDAFFCIPLSSQSQILSAFEWDSPNGVYQQLI